MTGSGGGTPGRARRRIHLRSRVLLLTAAFALTLVAITAGLSLRARDAQQKWERLVAVDSRAIVDLEEIIRAQNGFRMRVESSARNGDLDATLTTRYSAVTQLLSRESLERIPTIQLRNRIQAFRATLGATMMEWHDAPAEGRTALLAELVEASNAVVEEAQSIVDARRDAIATSIPQLERETRAMLVSGLAGAWILVLGSFALAQSTLRRVVRPVEDLARAADRLAAGELAARAPVAGDHEIARLGAAFNRMAAALAASHEQLRAHARTDELTALPNFRAFRERLDSEIERAGRYPARIGILVLDLDRFKNYNDTYGHLAGNGALQRVARAIRETVRTVDFPARYGGEEFAVILPEADPTSLAATAERIRAGIEAIPAPADGAPVTVSIGGALWPDDGRQPEALFSAADARLYEAKKGGRNRVVAPKATKLASA